MTILLSAKENAQFYFDAIQALGGTAEGGYLPEVCTDYDGLLLCGGCDVDPAFYAEPVQGAVNLDRGRDEREMELIKAFLDAGKPVMGICRGMQLLNVYFGGTLHQDLPKPNIHRDGKDPYTAHEVQAAPGSVFERLYGSNFRVNSYHHQAVKELAEPLEALVWNDGLVEAFVHRQLPVLATQWHPERMCFGESRTDTVDGSLILGYFLDMCK